VREWKRENKKGESEAPYFFVDACQAAGALTLNVKKLNVDLLALNGSKIYGPKGVGCLYIRKGVDIKPMIYGGGQERGIRSGTENVPGIVGFARALEIADAEREKESKRLRELRDYFFPLLRARIPGVRINGDIENRLPNNVNISIAGVEGDTLVIFLGEKGIYASTGSACSSTDLEPSHVLTAIGCPDEYLKGSLRFTLGRSTKKKDIEMAVEVLEDILKTLKGE
jgi:cysteine desulfurase